MKKTKVVHGYNVTYDYGDMTEDYVAEILGKLYARAYISKLQRQMKEKSNEEITI